MVRLALVGSDEPSNRELRRLLAHYSRDRDIPLRIDGYRDGDQAADRLPGRYDVLLMDAELPMLDGISAAREIRRRDETLSIIFFSASTRRALEGYRVDATDYLLKPIREENLWDAMDRALARLNRQPRSLMISLRGGRQRLQLRRIRYVEVRDHELVFHTLDGNFHSRGGIRKLAEKLAEENFFHCNKEYLVNLMHVDRVIGQDIYMGGEVITLSRTRRKAFFQALTLYTQVDEGTAVLERE